ncbi:hypothetical protein [Pseudomonas sp. Marseille-P9899]|uniref:hypothetical protein n=1 Tax=Pseudomonas sp. Marseille-P9899 TaxID=2730401 RepID=UPI00158F4F2E|nr:hypothetical protein [Pseudomonas sp. Marseille-P9899]
MDMAKDMSLLVSERKRPALAPPPHPDMRRRDPGVGKQPVQGYIWRAVSNNWPMPRRTVLRELINPLRRKTGDYQGCDRSLAVDPAPRPVGGYRQDRSRLVSEWKEASGRP